jgi:hypothetical protein
MNSRNRSNPRRTSVGPVLTANPPHSSQRSAGRFRYRFFAIIGFASAFYVPFGGQLYVGELLLFVFLPFALRRSSKISRPTALLCLLIAFYSGGGIISGVAAGDSTAEIVARTAAGAFLGISVLVLQLLNTTLDEYKIVIVWFSLGLLLASLVQPSVYVVEAPWKFGYGLPATMLALVLAGKFRKRFAGAVLLVMVAALNLALDYRSLAVVCLLSVVFGWRQLGAAAPSPHRKATGRAALLLLVSVGAVLALGSVYSALASSGALGPTAQYRYELQGQGGLVSLLLSGRYEIFYSLPAAIHNPILGYGTSSAPPSSVLNQGTEALRALGLVLIAERGAAHEGIPTHSAMMGAWVTSGIFGLVLWLFILGLFVRLLYLVVQCFPVPILAVFLTLLGIWNTLFSPFGATTRLLFAFTIAACISIVVSSHPQEQERLCRE